MNQSIYLRETTRRKNMKIKVKAAEERIRWKIGWIIISIKLKQIEWREIN
jgi:hypothetical protein